MFADAGVQSPGVYEGSFSSTKRLYDRWAWSTSLFVLSLRYVFSLFFNLLQARPDTLLLISRLEGTYDHNRTVKALRLKYVAHGEHCVIGPSERLRVDHRSANGVTLLGRRNLSSGATCR